MSSFISWEDAVAWLKSQPEMSDLVRDSYYDDPLGTAADRFYASSEWSAVRDLLADLKPQEALDIGAGRGISSYALARDGWKVTALEPDPSSVVGADAIRQFSADNGLQIMVVESTAESLPFDDQSFDLVYTRQSLHHAHDLDVFCSEVKRVLRPGGIFLATREHVIDREEDLQRFLDSHPLHNLYGGEHAYTLRRYVSALQGAGLQVTKVLATYGSEINLFPETKRSLLARIRQKYGVPIPALLYDVVVVPILNALVRTPGRLFSFMAIRPAE